MNKIDYYVLGFTVNAIVFALWMHREKRHGR